MNKKLLGYMAAVGAGLLYDAVMIALGAVWEGPVHLAFSQLRFVSHGVLIPLLFPICAYALGAGRKVLGRCEPFRCW